MTLKKYFDEKELGRAEKILQEFHGRLLLDSSISHPIAVALSVYMASCENKSPFVAKKNAKDIFVSFGRNSGDFDKVLYEITGKRKGKTKLIDSNGDKIGLNFEGVNKIKEVLKSKNWWRNKKRI